eukprot:6410224-Prymnesium_polylepis.1
MMGCPYESRAPSTSSALIDRLIGGCLAKDEAGEISAVGATAPGVASASRSELLAAGVGGGRAE